MLVRIPDPTAIKPANWDETIPPYVDDTDAKKPDGWLDSEPEMIPDPVAKKPDAWIDSEDGEWEAPLIGIGHGPRLLIFLVNPKCVVGCGKWTPPLKKNPLYMGKWTPPMIENPAYRGPWKARQIPNTYHYVETKPAAFLPAIGAGFELWTMQGGILFDNILITDDVKQAAEFAEATWTLKYDIERLHLEKELQDKGISDEPTDYTDREHSATENSRWVNLVARLMFFRRQMHNFIRLALNDPLNAIKRYPAISLNTLFLTICTIYFAGVIVSWLVGKTSIRKAVEKKTEEPFGSVQRIQKTGRVDDVGDLSVSNMNITPGKSAPQGAPSRPSSPSHSQIPRPVSPSRPLKLERWAD